MDWRSFLIMGTFIDLTGQRFGKLVVVNRAVGQYREAMWLCKCECGNEIITRGSSLRGGKSKSCGCVRDDYWKNQRNRLSHGGSHERLYGVWRGMIDRTTLPSHNRYKHYGGRGIKVCNEWRESYEVFRMWALNNGYNEKAARGECTIDRINVDGDYEPLNCQWVDMKKQANNKQTKGAAF